MKKPFTVFLSAVISLTGCATASKDVATNYVSPMHFQAYDCDQLASKSQQINSKVRQLGGRLDEAASNDTTIAWTGAILFWPALFALGGTKEQEAEYANLKGEYEAVEQSAVTKKCSGTVASNQNDSIRTQ
jgi:outer membrane murein-binding lipoprotein Lpp